MLQKQTRKPYTSSITYNFDTPVDIGRILMSPDLKIQLRGMDGRILEPSSIVSSTQRSRNSDNKKPKLLTSSYSQTDQVAHDPDGIFFKYDDFLFVDTNSRTDMASGKRHSITGLVHAYLSPLAYPSTIRYREIGAYEFVGPRVDAERLGWMTAIDAWLKADHYDPQKKVAVVVDAHHGLLPGINKRTLPVLERFFLPPNFEVIYATADTGMQFGLPYLMRYCDKVASRMFTFILERGHDFCDPVDTNDGRYETFRNWQFN